MTSTPNAFLIDLDDTLYSERSYVDAGYQNVASFLANISKKDSVDIFARLIYEHQKYGRSKVLNRVCDFFGIHDINIKDIIATYHDTQTPLTLYPGVEATLGALSSIAPLAIIPDGAPEIQRSKIARLNVNGLVSEVVYSWETGEPKPSPVSFLIAAKKLGVDLRGAIIIGDDPYHDGAAAMAAECKFIRVRTGKYKDVKLSNCKPFMEIDRFSKLRNKFHAAR